jgi:hypothetical protein
MTFLNAISRPRGVRRETEANYATAICSILLYLSVEPVKTTPNNSASRNHRSEA